MCAQLAGLQSMAQVCALGQRASPTRHVMTREHQHMHCCTACKRLSCRRACHQITLNSDSCMCHSKMSGTRPQGAGKHSMEYKHTKCAICALVDALCRLRAIAQCGDGGGSPAHSRDVALSVNPPRTTFATEMCCVAAECARRRFVCAPVSRCRAASTV